MRRMNVLVLSLVACLGLAAPANAATASWQGPQPLERAHAHNDYEHDRPLFDAVEHGFTSVEADVWLVDGELRVAHDLVETREGRTLESLYLDPLNSLVRANKGSVHPGWRGQFQLLIDIKSDGSTTYAAIDEALRDYRSMLTQWANGHERPGAVEVVISGNRPRADMLGQRVRLAGYDGRLSDLGTGVPAGFMPLVSDNWTRHFTWHGIGPMPQSQREKLHRIVAEAHTAGYRVRFWATPDIDGAGRQAVWRELVAADVDHLNTDDLPGLRDFLLENDPEESS
ncbi:phosphatidylinositol-specific phospholipase C/glycerophosphodiester phosphodiesterase family protein [Amycolatopsis palatopharyngis]|uniref:phosphatidylinositol-specific phospholipase C/glycerophosphodiester phosphodiesterase family protein n=1 Tax=Amycolatopsis palatopharyngis TaxID=187982 RepID=UPI000E21F4F0|nr:phosphatidylinositol-specific phospholipase C/glycerophosphodiester phosphodiesterase family protein [Amycolatopsis palatopharyngis]